MKYQNKADVNEEERKARPCSRILIKLQTETELSSIYLFL